MGIFSKVKDSISSLKYGSGKEKGLYYFIKFGSIALCVFIVLIVIGIIYAKVKGISIPILGI